MILDKEIASGLSKGSNVKINCKCDICGKEKILKYQDYIKNTKNFTLQYCCRKCATKKIKNTCLEKYGIENYVNPDKAKQTKKELYGDENYNNIQRAKETNLIEYGSENVFQNDDIKKKLKETVLKLYGVENVSQLKEIKQKKINTCVKNYGVEYPMQDPKLFKQAKIASLIIFQYKDTNIHTQGSFELYFVEQMDKRGFINEITNGKSYVYELEDGAHVYHSDFLFRGITIEIKSTWTYNKNGTNHELELKNETKWQTVRNNGDNIIILFSKKEIKNYVENLIL